MSIIVNMKSCFAFAARRKRRVDASCGVGVEGKCEVDGWRFCDNVMFFFQAGHCFLFDPSDLLFDFFLFHGDRVSATEESLRLCSDSFSSFAFLEEIRSLHGIAFV